MALSKTKKILIIAISATAVLLIIAGVLFASWYNKDPFENLTIGVSREDIEKTFGTPTETSRDADSYEGKYFLGKEGTLVVWYIWSDSTKVTGYSYSYSYPENPSKSDIAVAKSHIEAVIKYYDSKYGEHEKTVEGIDLLTRKAVYTWQLPDGKKLNLHEYVDNNESGIVFDIFYY